MDNNKLTVTYFTCRENPMIEWFFHSFNRERIALNKTWNEFEFLIIDYEMQNKPEERLDYFVSQIPYALEANIKISPPKPSPWQGKHRLTSQDYFAASSARNTAFILCNTDYIVCVDDLSVIKEGWLNSVLTAQKNREVVLGAYAKANNLTCNESGIYTFDTIKEGSLDSRYNNSYLGQNIKSQVGGSWLFGCSFAMPLQLALAVDGFDESCDGQGAEDYDFGIRIERLGIPLYYDKEMFTYENDEMHSIGNKVFKRDAKLVTEGTMMKNKVGIMSDHAKLQYILETESCRPFFASDLLIHRQHYQEHFDFLPSLIDRDWRTGEHLSNL